MSNTLDKKLSKTLFGVVGLFVAFMMAFGGTLTANAQSNEDLENQVSSLLDTIEQLQSRLDALQNGGGSTSASVDYTFTSNLSTGDQGVDVLKLQQALNADTDTRLAATGPGAPGQETNYYGPITANAVTRFQEKYASEVLFPVGLTNGTGYFGPSSRAQMNALLAANANTGDDDDDMDEDDDDDNEDEDEDEDEDNEDLEGGEASLEEFDFTSGDDNDVSEGGTSDIAEIEFDVEDGDVRVSRVDLSFIGDGDEQDPWDAFEEVALVVDGEEVASEDVSDEDDWLENDDEPYTFRFSGLDHIARDGDTVEMVVQVTAQNGVDGADDDDAEWVVFVGDDGVRATDGDDIEQYIGEDFGNDDEFDEFDGEDNTVTFDIEEEGEEDEFDVQSSSNDPDASTIEVDEDDTSDNYNIFTFTLDADDSEADIEVDQLPVLFTITGVGSATSSFDDVVDDMEIEIDGETFDDYDEEATTTDSDASTTEYVVTFDIDDDYVLEAGDEVDVSLNVEFNQTDGNYENGTRVSARVNSSDNDNNDDLDITGEGADDIVADGAARGDRHTLRDAGIYTENADTDTDTSGENDTTGVFTFEFDTGAFEEDFFIERDGDSVNFEVQGSNASTTADDTSITVRAPGADREDIGGEDYFRISEGDTENVRITVSVDPNTGGLYSVQLIDVDYFDDNGDMVGNYEFTPEEDYETDSIQINN